ncbi:MAG TPA: hypothetical protein VF163_02990 [Micromonosporaceae bacterium]
MAATLAKLNQAMAGLDTQARQLAEDQSQIAARRARLQAQQAALTNAIAQRLADEAGITPGPPRPRAGGVAGAALTAQAGLSGPGRGTLRDRLRVRQWRGVDPRIDARSPYDPRRPVNDQAGVDGDGGPETSPRSAQNTLLTLGGILLGIAATAIAGAFFTTAETGGRAFILGVTTTLALGVPVLLARRTLTATAETIAAFGLLLVLLDGYSAYGADLGGIATAVPGPLFAAILFALVTIVAAAYRLATHLRAPQFAALIASQPLLPLLALHLGWDRPGFATIFALVAAQNLGAVTLVRRAQPPALWWRRQSAAPAAMAWPRLLRELAWLLFGINLAGSVGLGTLALVRSPTIGSAVTAAAVLLLAAGVAVAGGYLAGREVLWHAATGGAALVIIACVSRVNAFALPEYTLVLTAAVAATIAVLANLLPVSTRRGPQLGSLIGAVVVAAVVAWQSTATAITAALAASTPQPWAADLTGYAGRVQATSWQVPAAALLIAILAAAATPGRWRYDSLVIGLTIVVFAAPGTGVLAWWTVPLLAVAVSTLATATALLAPTGRTALLRCGGAGLLGCFALATSLARPELTALTCAMLALIAAATTVVSAGWPDRFGPYADRVADSAGGAATITLPVAVATFAWLADAPSRVLLPVVMLTTAVGTVAAALSQVAARRPRTASAGGAVLAAAGGVVLSVTVGGATVADVALAVLILAAAVVTAGSRAFELTPVDRPGGPALEGSAPGAAWWSGRMRRLIPGRGRARRPQGERPRPRWRAMDPMTLGATLATAAVIVAMARLLAVVYPGVGLVTSTAMVFVASVGVLLLPQPWRRGPRLGSVAVGGAVGVLTAGVAGAEAVRTIAAGMPWWSTDLVGWSDRIAAWAPYGWQVPASLLLAAAAAWALLPAPHGADVAFVVACLAALAAPASLGLPWWSPLVIAGSLALIAGAGAALAGPDEPLAGRRLIFAAILGLYAVAAAAVSPGATATMLGAVIAGAVAVAAIAHLRADTPPLVPGVAAASGLLAGPGAAATIAIAEAGNRTTVLGAAAAVAALGAVVVAALRAANLPWRAYPALGVGLAALLIALATAVDPRALPVWSAVAALVAVGAAAAVDPPPALFPGLDRVDLGYDVPAGEGSPHQGQGQDPSAYEGSAYQHSVSGESAYQGDEHDPAGASAQPAMARTRPTDRWVARAVIGFTAGPAAVLAAVGTAPAWLNTLIGQFQTLRRIWQGTPAAEVTPHPDSAIVALVVLTAVAAAAALTLGGERYLLAAALPPVTALALSAPAALAAPPSAYPWVALAVALATGLGAALSPPALPGATRLLRTTSAVICALVGAAGLAGSLATRPGTLVALAVVCAAALIAAAFGRDPAVRMVAWFVASAAGFALPVTAALASGTVVRSAAFGVLAVCTLLLTIAWPLARSAARAAEATVIEVCAVIGAGFALLLTLGSARYASAAMTISGLLIGLAALRRDRPAQHRQWLVRTALAAEVAACWLLLYAVDVGLPEAYTLPFAAVGLLAGALELRRRPDLSSWLAYGPALAGGFLPSLALILIGEDLLWRWVALFASAIVIVILGTWRRRLAPVVTGSTVALIVAVVETIKLLLSGAIAGAILLGVAGLILIVFGALSEQRLRGALRNMS